MKNLSLALNIVLFVAVIVLFVLHFNGGSDPVIEPKTNETSCNNFTIAYIHSDSLTKNLQFVTDENAKLTKRSEQLETDLKNRAAGLQKELADYQANYDNLTIGQARTIEENLAQKEQNLRVFQERSRQELGEMQGATSVSLYMKVTELLKKYSDEHGIQMVVKFDPSSDVLFAGEGLDITAEIVDILNNDYLNPAPVASDTTSSN